jgi:3',5'-cyclic AMP phosphodiesterase CpdA
MRILCTLALLLAPCAALAATPRVNKGPVISAVTQTDAWVAWATVDVQGRGAACTSARNTTLPTLTLSPPGTQVQYQDPTCSRVHRVHLAGLAPDTAYTFRLDQTFENGQPAGGTFRTPPAGTGGRVRFVVYGDNRESPLGSRWRDNHQRVADGILSNEPDAPLLVHTGDLALNIPGVSGEDRGYAEFFDVERYLLGSRPIFVAIGNHETMDMGEYDDLMNGPGFAGSPHPYYHSVDWGPVHVAFLDGFEGPPVTGGLQGRAAEVSDEQLAWLDADLRAAAYRGQALFAAMHHGPYAHGLNSHGGSVPVQQRVLPILLKWRVHATLAGHDHYYMRGFEGCINYLITGAGGAPLYDPDPTAPGVKFAAKEESYAVITVDGSKVTGVAKDPYGNVLDSFELNPSDGTTCGVPPAYVPPRPDAGTPDAGAPADAVTDVDAGSNSAGDAGIPDAGSRPSIRDGGETGPVTAREEGCQCGGPNAASVVMMAGLVARRGRGRGRFGAR